MKQTRSLSEFSRQSKFARLNPIQKLEDLKVLRRSPDLFNHVKIDQGQQQGILIKHILFYHLWQLQPFWSSDLKQSIEYSLKQPSDF